MQQELWHDEFEDALWSTCEAIGPKVIGHELFPERSPSEGAKMLARCLSTERPEKLSAGQIALIIKRGREAGCHVAMAYLSQHASYATPKPVEPDDERAALQREYIECTRAMARIARQMERMNGD